MAPTVAAEVVRGFAWQRIGRGPALVVAAALCALAAVAGSAAYANALARREPDAAAALWPVNGFALANAASARIEAANAGRESLAGLIVPAEVRALSERATIAEPTSVQGLRNLALSYRESGDIDRATRLMQLAARLSARDTATNMWLVEDYLRQGDLPHATALIDTTLRTDTGAGALLLPQLALLLEQPGADAVMLDLLAGDPPWGHDFWTALLQSGAAMEEAASLRIALHRQGLRLAPGHDARLIEQLVEAREFAPALALYTEASRAAQYPPIDWRLARGSSLAVSLEANGKLAISALAGGSGVVAQRLLALPRGQYTLHIAGDAPLTARITCAHLQGERTLAVTLPGSGSFAQPTACRNAWLTLMLDPADADRSLTIRSVTLTRGAP